CVLHHHLSFQQRRAASTSAASGRQAARSSLDALLAPLVVLTQGMLPLRIARQVSCNVRESSATPKRGEWLRPLEARLRSYWRSRFESLLMAPSESECRST